LQFLSLYFFRFADRRPERLSSCSKFRTAHCTEQRVKIEESVFETTEEATKEDEETAKENAKKLRKLHSTRR
jgi:hypothetical protein